MQNTKNSKTNKPSPLTPLPPPLRQQVFPAALIPSFLIPLTHKVKVSVKVIVKEKNPQPSTLNPQLSAFGFMVNIKAKEKVAKDLDFISKVHIFAEK